MKKSSAAISELARPARAKSDSSQVSPKDQFEGRKSSELVIAFAGPIGSGIKTVVDLTNERLVALGYTVHRIKLSVLIDNAFEKGLIRKSPENTVDRASRYIRLQEGGNDLRGDFGNDILAEWSVREIVGIRSADIPSDLATRHKEFVPGRVAYLVDQIKHPAEVDLFRAVYRNLFYLIGVVSVASSREGRLAQEHVPAGRISDLIERDRKQEEENGQQLDKALQMADFFVRNDRGNLEPVKTHITRFLSLLHGENGVTPTRQEYGMYVAFAAGLKSACMSRQVGAAIANSEGVVIATGCNDVPKPGGGLYTTEDGHNDHRCVHKEQQVCFNDKEKNELRDAMGKSLKSILDKVAPDAATDESLVEKLLTDLYGASKIKDLIEFSRAVHAEMEAIISLARVGGSGLTDAVLYTTTFPCHSCARHIVAAGISRVYYIEPYEKSLAKRLHDDAIQFDTEESVSGTPRTNDKLPVKFVHFEGIAPRQYLRFFTMNARKNANGKVIKILPAQASKTVNEYLDDYRDFEAKVVQHLQSIIPADLDGKTA